MPFRWPTDPPGKPPRHSIPWAAYQATQHAQQQSAATAASQQASFLAHPAPVKPAAPAVPAAPVVPPNPRDSEYTGGIGELIAQRQQGLAAIGQERTYATQDRDDALKRLTEGRTQSLLNGKRGANNRGLFYSTFLTNENRDTNRDYDDQQTGVQRTFKKGEDDRIGRQATIDRLYGKGDSEGGYGSEGARLLREAIQRALQRQLGLAA